MTAAAAHLTQRGGRFTDPLFGGLNYQIGTPPVSGHAACNLSKAQAVGRAHCAGHAITYTEGNSNVKRGSPLAATTRRVTATAGLLWLAPVSSPRAERGSRVHVDEHIPEILATTSGRPLTVGDLAGRPSISPTIVRPAARRLVDDDLASAAFIRLHSVLTLHGSLPRPTAKGA